VQFIDWLLGTPLGWLLFFCHKLVRNYGVAIVLFAIATKTILFPLSLLAQRNAIVMARLKPRVDDIKRRFAGNSSLILSEQQKLYKHNHYSALKGALPLLVQIPLILGVIAVVYHPLKHVLRLTPTTIQALVSRAADLLSTTPDALGYAGETRVIQLVQDNPGAFADVAAPQILSSIQSVHLEFFGLNLAQVPVWGSITIIWPILSGLSALGLCLYQNKYYVLQKFAGPANRVGLTVFMVLFSGYFAAVLPGAFGLYWTAGNLLAILVVWLCNLVDDPRKTVDYSAIPVRVRLTPEQRRQARAAKRESAVRSREDQKRFRTSYGDVLVYAEGSGYWKYFSGVVSRLLDAGVTIRYVTSDVKDPVFARASDTFHPYYISPRALIPFMMQLDVDTVLMTLPDLEKFHIKRSLVRKDIEYIYLDHGMTSLHLTLREGALDHFDTIFCNGPNHIEEMRQTERAYGLPAKTLVPTGYPLLDDMIGALTARGERVRNDPPVALVAPSWQPENLLELCLPDVLNPLFAQGFHVILRPHPEFVKQFGPAIDAVRREWAAQCDAGVLEIQTDFSSSSTVYNADVVVTDWSTIAQEFSYCTKKPSIFINTPMKVMNPNWQAIDAVPTDITLRDQIGVSVHVDALDGLGAVAQEMVDHPHDWTERITAVMEENLFNLGHAAQACADYVLSSREERQRRRDLAQAEVDWQHGTATPRQQQLLADDEARCLRARADRARQEADALDMRAHTLREEADALDIDADAWESRAEEEEGDHALSR